MYLPALPSALAALYFAGLAIGTTHAGLITTTTDNFGSGADSFSIQFATVGNAGNGNDAGAGGGIYSSPYGGVSYNYRIGVTEVSHDWITKATSLGMTNVPAGPWTGNQPGTNISWFESAAFVNWLNTSNGHQAAYNLTWTGGAWTMALWSSGDAWQLDGENLYRHKDAYYFLPSENEWYKAAFHKNDEVTANYWDYATGSNSVPTVELTGGTIPGSAVFSGEVGGSPAYPAAVTLAGGLSPYGTMGQNGNVSEWKESASDGSNDSLFEERGFGGGFWADGENLLRSSFLNAMSPSNASGSVGFRVASIEPIPEPSTALFGLACLGVAALCRRRDM